MAAPVTCTGPAPVRPLGRPVEPVVQRDAGGADPAAKTLDGGQAGRSSWTASENAPWLSLARPRAARSRSRASLGSLTAGTYTTDITVSARRGATDGRRRRSRSTFTVDRAAPRGHARVAVVQRRPGRAPTPAPKTVSIANTGGGTLSWTGQRRRRRGCRVSPDQRQRARDAHRERLDSAGSSQGTYTPRSRSTAPGAAGCAALDPRDAHRRPAAAHAHRHAGRACRSPAVQGGTSPAAKTLTVPTRAAGRSRWTASENVVWLSLSDRAATRSRSRRRSPGLTAGTYTTDITVSAPGAIGAPKTIPVTLTLDRAAPGARAVAGRACPSRRPRARANPASKTSASPTRAAGRCPSPSPTTRRGSSVTPASGTAPATPVGGAVDRRPRARAPTPATVTVTAAAPSGSPKTIAVTLTVTRRRGHPPGWSPPSASRRPSGTDVGRRVRRAATSARSRARPASTSGPLRARAHPSTASTTG